MIDRNNDPTFGDILYDSFNKGVEGALRAPGTPFAGIASVVLDAGKVKTNTNATVEPFKDSNKSYEEWRKASINAADPANIEGMTKGEAIYYAAQMGMSDSVRGIKQWWGKTWDDEELLEGLRLDHERLVRIMQHEDYGGAAMGTFYGTALVDPVGFVPYAGWGKKLSTANKGVNAFKDFVKYGVTTGAVMSGIAYTPEDYSLFFEDDSPWALKKAEQTVLGGAVGGLLSGGGAKVADIYMRNRHGYSLFDAPEVKAQKIFAKEKEAIQARTGDEVILRRGEPVYLPDVDDVGTITKVNRKENIVYAQRVDLDTGKITKHSYSIDTIKNPLVGPPVPKDNSYQLKTLFVSTKVDDMVDGKPPVDSKGNPKYFTFDNRRKEQKLNVRLFHDKDNDDTFYSIFKVGDIMSMPSSKSLKNIVQKNNLSESNWIVFKHQGRKAADDLIKRTPEDKRGVEFFNQLDRLSNKKEWGSSELIFKSNTLKSAKNFILKETGAGTDNLRNKSTQKYVDDIVENSNNIEDDMVGFNYSKPLKSIWQKYADSDFAELLYGRVIPANADMFAGGFAGGVYGYSTLPDDYNAQQFFTRTLGMTLAGAVGGRSIKYLDNSYNKGRIREFVNFQFMPEYGLSQKYKDRSLGMMIHRNKIQHEFDKIIREASETLTPDENRLLYLIMTGEPIDPTVIAKDGLKIGKKGRDLITKYAKQMVDNGSLNAETFQKNKDIYMKRVYLRPNAAKKNNLINVGTDIKIIGDNLKRRGFTHPSFITKKTYEKDFKPEGFYIIKGSERKDGKFKVARDWTKAERELMGELEDFSLSLYETGKLMSNDIAAKKFFTDIADNFSISQKQFDELDDIAKKGYYRIGDMNIKGTQQKKYGDLAGRYVDKYVYNDITATFANVAGDTTDFGVGVIGKANSFMNSNSMQSYNSLISLWKKMKTTWNLGTHVANTASNFVLIDFAGTDKRYIAKAFKEIKNNSKLWQEANINGAMSADMVSNELNRTAKMFGSKYGNLVEELDPAETVLGSVNRQFKYVWNSKNNYLRRGLDKAEQFYQLEDQLFRMAVYMDRLDKGFNKIDAAKDARKWFIDYNITAPGVNLLKRTVLPFISYTYRVAPLLLEGSIRRPSALIKWGAYGYGLSALGTYVSEDTEEGVKLDRLSMRENDKKTLWNIPIMPPTMIRLPFNSSSGDALYLDVQRWLPGGDIFMGRESQGLGKSGFLSKLPQPLKPGGPVVDLAYMVMTGEDPFTGQEIEDKGVAPILRHFLSHQLPNMPFVPGSYAWEKLAKSRAQGTDNMILGYDIGGPDWLGDFDPNIRAQMEPSQYSTPFGLFEALAYGVGIKVRPIDYTREINALRNQFRVEEEEIKQKIKQNERDARTGGIKPEQYEKRKVQYADELVEVLTRLEKLNNAVIREQAKLSKKEGHEFNEQMKEEIKKSMEAAEGFTNERDKFFDGGGVDVPYTKDTPRDRVDMFTGRPYSDQMENLGFLNENNS